MKAYEVYSHSERNYSEFETYNAALTFASTRAHETGNKYTVFKTRDNGTARRMATFHANTYMEG